MGRIEMRARGAGATASTIAAFAALSTVLALAGCVGSPAPSPSPTKPLSSPSASATPSATPLALQPHESASANLPYFDSINRKVLAVNPNAVGADFIAALVAGGFSKADMQLTADKTTVNLPAGSIQFSVKFRGECLIGQNGAGSGGYQSEVTPLLATGNCLIGGTVPLG